MERSSGPGIPSSVLDAVGVVSRMLDGRSLLITSDFDGTLSSPRMDPWAASIIPGARSALRRLASTDDVHVALLSGRTARDLSTRVRVGAATYLGNQGLEHGWLPRGQRAERLVVTPHPASPRAEEVARRLISEVPTLIPDTWLIVESKLPAVTFHYRSAPDVPDAASRVSAAVDLLDPNGELVRHHNRRSLELRPQGAPAKGEAFRALLDAVRPGIALMLGDDRTDVAAFRVLQQARRAGEVSGLAIGVCRDEASTADVGQDADLLLAGPEAAARFLGALARRLARSSP